MSTNKGEAFFRQIAAMSVVIASASVAPISVQAQESGAIGGLEEIVVTARRREELLKDTPVSITAFSNEDLKARQIDHISQISEATPGLVFRRQSIGSNASATVFIRGIGQSSARATAQPGVGLYMDGVYVAQMQGSLIELVDIENVEVLRGPQGTLFGRNAIGGAIQINTVKPSNEFGGKIELVAGDFSRRQIKGSVNVPFTDTFFGQFSASVQEKEGYIKTPNIPGSDGKGGDDNTSARVALRWLPSDAVTVDFAADIATHESGGEPTVLDSNHPFVESGPDVFLSPVGWNDLVGPALGLPLYLNDDFLLPSDQYTSLEARNPQLYTTANAFPGMVGRDLGQEAEWDSLSLTVTWDLNDSLTLKSITNSRTFENDAIIDFDQSPAEVLTSGEFYDGDQFSQEFQLSGTAFDDRLSWVAGLYYFEESVDHINTVNFPLFRAVNGALVDNKSTAAFGQFTYDVTDQFHLTVGLRHTEENLDNVVDDTRQYVLNFFDPTIPGYPAAMLPVPNGDFRRLVDTGLYEADIDETEPYINLAYDFSDEVMGYVSYSQGFKGGGFNQNIAPGVQFASFGPEFAKVFEIGAKFATDRLRMNTAIFFTDYTDLQVATQRQLGGSILNAADAEIRGGELEVVGAITDRFDVSFGLGFLDGEYKNLGDVTFDVNNRLPNVADLTVNAAASYRFSLPSGELVARLDYFNTDDYFTEADNKTELYREGYHVYNGSLTYIHNSEKWEVGIQGRNITDEFYFMDGGLTDLETVGFVNVTVGPPAEWSGRFTYRF